MLRAVIIDDEKKARETILSALSLYCKNVEIIGEAEGVSSGFKLISQSSPDIVFLDIKMLDGSGFDLLNMFDKIDFFPIFITAYNDFAIKAFKFSALDYIVKPVDPDELIYAVNKASEIKEKSQLIKKLNVLRDSIDRKDEKPEKIVLKTEKYIHIAYISDIIHIESEGNYTTVFFKDETKIVVSKLIKEFESLLSSSHFLRIHQSYLINMDYLKSFNKQTGFVSMINNKKIPVAIRKKSTLLDYLSKF